MINYIAHKILIDNEEKVQTIKEHSVNVAELVREFSKNYCDNDIAYNLGLLHDVGKYQESFQRRINGSNEFVEHAICGAKVCKQNLFGFDFNRFGQFVISCHHTGLCDLGDNTNTEEDSTLFGKMKRETGDFSFYEKELPLIKKSPVPPVKISIKSQKDVFPDFAFWIRFMFSCLTDADFLDTEKFCKNIDRNIDYSFNDCYEKLQNKFNSFSSNTPIQKARNMYRTQIMSKVNIDSQIYYMNMPTGSGKTLASMEFALKRAILKNKKHIIYVIPYTSIIEQNANVFKNIFGEQLVLEHHCNFDFDTIKNYDTKQKLKLATENWDMPFIITTNVQFFESLYGNKSSQVRKLHNIANSVIVFDEVHSLPLNYYEICLRGIKNLVTQYDCEALFLSATMPDFDFWLDSFNCKGLKTLNLIDSSIDDSIFKRCKVEYLNNISKENLIMQVQKNNSCLIVVNKRKTAREVYSLLPKDQTYHLSTYMNHYDRSRVINIVKEKLAKNEKVYLVSTSLIEAGVDIDFDCVFREIAGIDNILQSAGRCNREGKKSNCKTYAFKFEDVNDTKDYQKYTANNIFEKYKDVTTKEAIKEYFNQLFSLKKEQMKIFNIDEYFNKNNFDFKRLSEDFKYIDSNQVSIVVYTKENQKEVDDLFIQIENGSQNAKRKLQKYIVSVYDYEYTCLKEQGVLASKNNIICLINSNYYSSDIGVLFEDNNDYIF